MTLPATRHDPDFDAPGGMAYFKAIVDTVRQPILVLDSELRIEAANASFYRIFQVSPGETVGRLVYGLGNGQWDIPGLRTLLEEILASDSAFEDFEVEHEFPSIGRKRMRLNARRLVQAGTRLHRTLLSIEDITEARKAENYRKLFETAHDGIIVLDLADGRITDSNLILSRMLGFPQGAMVGKEMWEVGLFGSKESSREFFDKVRSAGSNRNPGLHVLTGDGRDMDIELACSICSLGDERMVQCNARDITERVRAEKSLRLSEEKLRQSHKMAAIGRLAGGIAHDFNNILTSVNGFGALCLSMVAADSVIDKYLREILGAGQRAAELTKKLLAYSRQLVLSPKLVDLNALIRDRMQVLGKPAREDIRLELELGSGLRLVKVDPDQLEQVLINLVMNAREAMDAARPGTITISTCNIELDEEYGRQHPLVYPGGYVRLSVSDTGIGMDDDLRSRIFEPFFTTKGFGRATGLGLAMVHGIVTQCEGYIFVYSEPGIGSTFKIYLPHAKEPANGGPDGSSPRQAGRIRGGETILVVENDEAVLRYARKILETQGYQVLHALDGASALDLAERSGAVFQLLLTDIIMPGMNGPDLARKIRASHPDCRVLFMSGYGDPVILQHGILEADSNRIQKPFTPKDLSGRVNEILAAGLAGR